MLFTVYIYYYLAIRLAIFACVPSAFNPPFDHPKEKMLYRDILVIVIVAAFVLLLLASVCLLKYYNQLMTRTMPVGDDLL